MNWNPIKWFKSERIDESIKSFKNKSDNLPDKQIENQTGEGRSDMQIEGYGVSGLSSFNHFYNSHINKQHKNEVSKIGTYRNMSNNPEISDVIEDAVNESLQENDGNIISLEIQDETINKKEDLKKKITKEFNTLFYNKFNISNKLWELLNTYYIDGRVYFENIINKNKQKEGLIDLKLLPSETMDRLYDKYGRVIAYVQYLTKNAKRPQSIEEAEKDKEKYIVFYPEQINFIPYQYGNSKSNIYGYLEKCKIPYNQLKLLETSMIIYRIVRAPERFVFKIDTGSMPRDKSMKYVQKFKQKMNKKESFDPNSGTLLNNSEILCIRQNTEIKLLDGRSLPLTEVIKEFNEGKETWVYTVNEKTKKIEPGKIQNAQITRPNEKLIRVHLDDNNYVDTTYDHKFIMRDGSRKRADQLKENDSLMPLYTKYDNLGGKSKSNYEYIYDLKENKWTTTHKMVCESTQRKRKYGEVIHHKDFSSLNNSPNNLKLMNCQDHIKYHSKHAKEFWEKNYEKMCEIRREQGERVKNDPELSKKQSEITTYWNKYYNKVEKLLEALNEPENREKQKQGARNSKIEYFKNSDNRKKQGEQMKINQLNNPNAFLENVKKPKSDSHKEKISSTLKNKWDNDEDYRKQQTQKNKERYNNDPTLKERISESQKLKTNDQLNELIIKECHENNNITLKKLANNLSLNEKFISIWKELNKNIKAVKKDKITVASLVKIIDRMGYNGFNDFKENTKYNHKVLKIEYLEETDDTGCITVEGNHNFAVSMEDKSLIFLKNSIQDNFFIPQGENRGSDISTIGGSNIGFKDLDDIHYFQKKLYRALKYPLSRIENKFENRSGDNLFGGNSTGEITRDEIKWSKFLERQQNKFSEVLKEIFILHLKFKGLKDSFGLDRHNFQVSFNPPSDYREQMKQNLRETRFNNYMLLSNEQEFSKVFLMKKYLDWSEEEIKENAKSKEEDKKLKLVPEEGDGGGFGF